MSASERRGESQSSNQNALVETNQEETTTWSYSAPFWKTKEVSSSQPGELQE